MYLCIPVCLCVCIKINGDTHIRKFTLPYRDR